MIRKNKTTKLFLQQSLKTRKLVSGILFVFLFSLVLGLKPVLAIDGLMNGRQITAETDNFLLWLQTYDSTTAPYFTDRFFIDKSGNVGIGTTAPTAKLHINPGATPGIINTGSTQFSLLGGSGNVLLMADNTGTLYSTTTASFVSNNVYSSKIVVNPTSGVGWYRIASGNQVGGTVYIPASIDNTGQTLEFNYTLRSYIGDNNSVGTINVLRTMNYNTGPITQIRIAANSTTGDYNAYLDIYVSQATAPVAFTVYGTNGASFLATPIYNPAATTYSQVVDLNNISLRGMATSQNLYVGNQARIGQQLLVDLAAHIKLTSPNETSEQNRIMTGIMPTPSGSLATTTGQHLLYDFGDAGGNGLILSSGGGSDAGGIKITNDGVAMWGAGDTDLLRVIDEDTNLTRLLINDSGNVGIGATLPTAKLHVYTPTGEARQTIETDNGVSTLNLDGSGTGSAYVSSLRFANNNDSVAYIESFLDGAVDSGNLIFETQSAGTMSDRMIIKSNGNVGIGTINPGYKLQLSTTAYGYQSNIVTNQPENWNLISSSDGTGEYGISGDKFFVQAHNTLQGLYLTNDAFNAGIFIKQTDGNVGIGTTAPATALDVSGTLRNTLATTHSLLGGGGNVLVMADNTGALYTTSTASFIGGASMWGGTKNGTIFNGDAGAGNVGIGTTTPAYKLDIFGTFRATSSGSSIILDASGNISIGI